LEATVATRDDHDLGYAEICAGLSARFCTRFYLEITGESTALVARFEGGVKVMITDCGVSLSPVDWHLAGRAAGYYVGVHTATSNVDGRPVRALEQLGYACDPTALPTEEAIGELVHQALAYVQFLRDRT
jgi:hypothetical protein